VTEDAVARGAFGAPAIFVHQAGEAADSPGELYFGSDRFHILFPEVRPLFFFST
jgi:2-hydroxychromene-2-carboxylate isomerase